MPPSFKLDGRNLRIVRAWEAGGGARGALAARMDYSVEQEDGDGG